MFRALWSWIVCVIVTVVVSLMTKPKPETELVNLVYRLHGDSVGRPSAGVAAAHLLGRRGGARCFIALNIIFW